MSPQPPQRRPRPSRNATTPEFGDWRVQLSHPEEAEHYPAPPLSVWKVAKLRMQQFEQGASYGALWRHSVSVTYTEDTPAYPEEEDYGIQPIHGAKRILRLLVAILVLLPLSITLVYALGLQLFHALPRTAANSSFWLSEPIYFSLLGAFTFLALIIAQFATPILIYLYVLGHELTHALAALCCFGKVSAVNVDLDGGYIETDKDNLFIALAPYFVPLWPLVWMLLTAALYLFLPRESVDPWFFGGCGFLWSFHIYWTIWVIPREQPDLLENGVMFSLLFVVIMNILILIGILRFFNFISLRGYWDDLLTCGAQLLDTLAWLFSTCFS